MKEYFNKLNVLYMKMDKAYDKAALHYGFECNGCEDNCCKSFFYHHTYIEKDYLLSKTNEFDLEQKKALKTIAEKYLKDITLHNQDINKKKPLCPLNKEEKCILYDQRPMICRLHGIPHHLNIPGKEINHSPGCDAGDSFFSSTNYFSFDRIPYYKEMAEIEKEYRASFSNTNSKSGKIKQTIAHMLLDVSV